MTKLSINTCVNALHTPNALRPDHKGIAENGFKLLKSTTQAEMPGFDPPESVLRRRGKHYEKDACLTLEEIKAVVLQHIIVDRWTGAIAWRPLKTYPLSAAQALKEQQEPALSRCRMSESDERYRLRDPAAREGA
jgi:hypothetical protein